MLHNRESQIAIKSEKHYNKVVKVLSKLGYTECRVSYPPSEVMWLKLYHDKTYSDYTHSKLIFNYPEVTLKQLKGMLNEN